MAAEESIGASNSVAANADMDHVRARKRSYKLALHNVVAYYSQFSESLEVAIKHHTLGIENKLKEYSKLCQAHCQRPRCTPRPPVGAVGW